MYQNFIIPYLYEAQHVSGDTPPIIRSLKLHWQLLVFHTWKIGRVGSTIRPTTFHVWKTTGCQWSFRLLIMGGVSPETCWASYKYVIIKLWYVVASCWIFLYELYYDARIHEHLRQSMTWTGTKPKTVNWEIRGVGFGMDSFRLYCLLTLASRTFYWAASNNFTH